MDKLTRYTKEELATYVQRSEYALDLGRKATIIGAVAASLVGFVALMGSYSDPSTIGPNLAVMILTLFYASIVALVLLIIKGRVHKKA